MGGMEKYCKRCGEIHDKWRYRAKKKYWDCNQCRSDYYRKNKFIENIKDGLYSCEQCSFTSPLRSMFDIDHIRPRSEGGGNGSENIQVICPNCHREKTVLESWSTWEGRGRNIYGLVSMLEKYINAKIPGS